VTWASTPSWCEVSRRYGTLSVTFWAFSGGLLLVVPLALIESSNRAVGTITGGILLGILYLGVISTAAAMWMWNRAFALVDANRASLFFFAQPFVGTLLGVLVLDQPLAANVILGAILILGGVMVPLVGPARRSDQKFLRPMTRAAVDVGAPLPRCRVHRAVYGQARVPLRSVLEARAASC
jgi:drug/metabolite transporter (DMT)-like permease